MSLKTEVQEAKSSLSEKNRCSSVLRKGQDRKHARKRGLLHMLKEKASESTEQGQGCNAVPSLSSGKNPYPSGSNGEDKQSNKY